MSPIISASGLPLIPAAKNGFACFYLSCSPATLLDHVTPAMRIYYEEAFGPVKGIVLVDGVEAAVACANDNAYGLAAAVFGGDIARAFQIARRIESGICHVNGPTVHDEAQRFCRVAG